MVKPSFEIFRRFKGEWIVFVIAVLLAVVLLGFHLFKHYNLILTQEKEQLVYSATTSEAIITRHLEESSITLDNIRTAFSLDKERDSETNNAFSEYLEILASAMINVESVSVLDTQGIVIVSSKKQLIGQSFAYRDYFRVPESTSIYETLYISKPFKSIYNDWLVVLSKVFLDRNGAFAGIVFIALNVNEYGMTLDTLRPSPQVWSALAYGDGLLFSWKPDNMALIGHNFVKPGTLFTQHMESGRSVSFFSDIVAANNEMSFVAIHTINPASLHMSEPFVLAVGQNVDKLYMRIRNEAIYLFVVLMIFTVFVGMVLYLFQRTRWASVLKAEQAEASLRKLSQQLTSFFEFTPSLMIITDKKERSFLRINPACQKVLGYTEEDFGETLVLDYIHPDDRDLARLAFNDLLDERSPQPTVFRVKCRDGQYRYLEVSMAAESDMLFFAALDVTDREIEKEQLHALAYHDRLTGLPNRALFFDRLHQILATSLRGKKKVAVMFIDLDGFKIINDTYGHDAGDKVLQAVAQRLVSQVRKADTVARMGGDEFVIILQEIGSEDDSIIVAQKVMDVVGKEIPLDSGETVRVGASIGISLWPDHSVAIDGLLVLADRAMYQSKKKGKNTFTIASENIFDRNDLRFSDVYRLGIDLIDTQHLELAGSVGNIVKALRDGRKPSEITEIVNELYVSTKYHFDTENEFMERYEYPDRDTHNKKHQLLLQELQDMGPFLFREGGKFFTERLYAWLMDHILEEDIDLGDFLIEVKANCVHSPIS